MLGLKDMTAPSDLAPPAPGKKRRTGWRRWWLIVFVAAAAVAAGVAVALWPRAPHKAELVWLDAAAAKTMGQPDTIEKLRRQLTRYHWGLWLWRHFSPARRFFFMSSIALRLAEQETDPVALGPAAGTNTDGTRVWILDRTGVELFRRNEHVKQVAGNRLPPGPLVVGHGPYMIGFTADSAVVPSLSSDTWVTMTKLTQVSGDWIRLESGWSRIETSGAGSPSAQTNGLGACRLLIPDGGAVVMNMVRRHWGTNLVTWLMVSYSSRDENGKPYDPAPPSAKPPAKY